MDSSITLSYDEKVMETCVSNIFIDKYMADASGEYVKVYLCLLRMQQDPDAPVSIAEMVQKLDVSSEIIKKALAYWDSTGIITLTCKDNKRNGRIVGITIKDLDENSKNHDEFERKASGCFSGEGNHDIPTVYGKLKPDNDSVTGYKNTSNVISSKISTIPERRKTENDRSVPVYNAETMFRNFPELLTLKESIESQYYMRKMMPDEIQFLFYMYDQFEFSNRLIEYLYDYCFRKTKQGEIEQIKSVANSWNEMGIVSPEQVITEIFGNSELVREIRYALGIKDEFKPAELEMIENWSTDYGMSDEIIRKACDIGVLSKGDPGLRYINSIIENWSSKNVKSIQDIERLDEEYRQKRLKLAEEKAVPRRDAGYSQKPRQSKSSYFDFAQRTYTDEEIREFEMKKLRGSKLLG